MENKVIVNVKDNGMVDVIDFDAFAFQFDLDKSEMFAYEMNIPQEATRSRSMCNSCIFKAYDDDNAGNKFVTELYYRFIKLGLKGTPGDQINNLNKIIQKMMEEYGYKPLLDRMKDIIIEGNKQTYNNNPRMFCLYGDLSASMKTFNSELLKMEEDLLVKLSVYYYDQSNSWLTADKDWDILEVVNNISDRIYQLSIELFTILINMDKYVVETGSVLIVDDYLKTTKDRMEGCYEMAISQKPNFKKIFINSLPVEINSVPKQYKKTYNVKGQKVTTTISRGTNGCCKKEERRKVDLNNIFDINKKRK